MKELQFSIKIYASKEKVWSTLFDDQTFREWANFIDEGTYMSGVLKEGNNIQFISSTSGYGVTSLVKKLILNEYVLFHHNVDTKNNGKEVREDEWTGGKESYTLFEKEKTTTLLIKTDVPLELEDIFNERFHKAIESVKDLAEK